MAAASNRPVVAVLNTSKEIIEILSEVLEDEGMQTVTAYIVDFKRGNADLQAFLAEHHPQAIVYDIVPPYEDNWKFFQTIRGIQELKDCKFVLTTTNKDALETLVGPTGSFELVGKPYDLNQVVSAVRMSLEQCE